MNSSSNLKRLDPVSIIHGNLVCWAQKKISNCQIEGWEKEKYGTLFCGDILLALKQHSFNQWYALLIPLLI